MNYLLKMVLLHIIINILFSISIINCLKIKEFIDLENTNLQDESTNIIPPKFSH